ncbi:MAG: beta-galactosidase [Patescibacteria group bacterium]
MDKKGGRILAGVKIVLATLVVLGAAFLVVLNLPATKKETAVIFGVTFSTDYAASLGLDWRQTFLALLDDLSVRKFRLNAYWSEIEAQRDTMNFDSLDFQLDEAAKRDAKVLLAVGRKLPRWPECHDPAWVRALPKKEIEERLLKLVRAVVERYKDHPAVEKWQVENEIVFPFGDCPNWLGLDSLQKELDLVRSLSDKPIVVTDSGEWTPWIPMAWYGDILGSSLYLEAWNDYLGHIPFPIRPGYYQFKAWLVSPWKKDIIFTELQAEPWGPKAVQDMSVDEARNYFPLEKMRARIQFARDVGFREVYLWGEEWWYWMKQYGDSSYWDEGKKIFQ